MMMLTVMMMRFGFTFNFSLHHHPDPDFALRRETEGERRMQKKIGEIIIREIEATWLAGPVHDWFLGWETVTDAYWCKSRFLASTYGLGLKW